MSFQGYVYDGEIYCEFHCGNEDDEGVIPISSDEESDYPMHCSVCGRPISHNLTPEGIAYVLKAVKDELRKPRAVRMQPTTVDREDWWYRGTPSCSVVLDWAKTIEYYNIDEREQRIVDYFIRWSQ